MSKLIIMLTALLLSVSINPIPLNQVEDSTKPIDSEVKCRDCDKQFKLPKKWKVDKNEKIAIKILEDILPVPEVEIESRKKKTLNEFGRDHRVYLQTLYFNEICKLTNCFGWDRDEAIFRVDFIFGEMFDNWKGSSFKPSYSIDGIEWNRKYATENVSGSIPNKGQPGYLYTWEAAQTVCQAQFGNKWRLPSDKDWSILAASMGGYWDFSTQRNVGDPKVGLTQLTKKPFSLQPSGYAGPDGILNAQRHSGYFWTSTNQGTDYAITFSISPKDEGKVGPHIGRSSQPKQSYYSVICVCETE